MRSTSRSTTCKRISRKSCAEKRNAAHPGGIPFSRRGKGEGLVFHVEIHIENYRLFLNMSGVFFRPVRQKMMFPKNPQTRMNTRKTHNHKGCGFSCFVVGVGGLEPPASWSRTKRATSCATPRQPFHYRRSCPRCQGKFTTHCHFAGFWRFPHTGYLHDRSGLASI